MDDVAKLKARIAELEGLLRVTRIVAFDGPKTYAEEVPRLRIERDKWRDIAVEQTARGNFYLSNNEDGVELWPADVVAGKWPTPSRDVCDEFRRTARLKLGVAV